MGMSTDSTALYPDIAKAGSLAAALRAAAIQDGFSVPFSASESAPLCHAAVASSVPHRTALEITAWVAERRWSICGCETFQGMALIDGTTHDLTDIARAASFVHLTGRFEVAGHDPVRLAESEWQHLLTEAGEVDWPEYRALVEAAYAEPALRGLYPFRSHWTLRFSTSSRPRLTGIPVCLDAHRDSRYTLSAGFMGEILVDTIKVEDAVSAAVRHLPSGLGPVTSGAV
ncbi:DUF6193 family natural product biosynthesis protein [Streptomyces scabiei]|uniref:DUF6193 family natural product biosynthesis protein n=1 Tax=Streptomyces scabiei TaxID=1930 RepID=UPI0004E792C8|nr:DUF6193 family natural product biosynthesis protein [Streptomyces scabiei]KFG03820.1 hypothetical protein IQ61_39060 [Streptomyces scabiei]MDX2834401.1 DUF6193 family natural product biosynthesis protein [Streptomyces scabiei]MDX3674048.1 DUF6193 family natural product biosynthesis protein [Streptomyces scabiei]